MDLDKKREKTKWGRLFPKLWNNLYLGKNLKHKHLDFGCGNGIFDKLIAEKKDIKILAIDSDKLKIKSGRENYANKKIIFTSHLKGKEKFDSISLIRVIHEIRDVKKILSILYSHLNKGGKILIYDFKKSKSKELKKLYNIRSRDISYKEYYRKHNRWTMLEFKKIIESIGFRTIKINSDGKIGFFYIGIKNS